MNFSKKLSDFVLLNYFADLLRRTTPPSSWWKFTRENKWSPLIWTWWISTAFSTAAWRARSTRRSGYPLESFFIFFIFFLFLWVLIGLVEDGPPLTSEMLQNLNFQLLYQRLRDSPEMAHCLGMVPPSRLSRFTIAHDSAIIAKTSWSDVHFSPTVLPSGTLNLWS